MPLTSLTRVRLPAAGGFDHGDVHLASGRVVFAHTEAGTIDIIDGPGHVHIASLPGCPQGSGVACDQAGGVLLVASRGNGEVYVVDPIEPTVDSTIPIGPAPNGIAVDSSRRRCLVADVAENAAFLVDIAASRVLSKVALSGRPRWAAYDAETDRYLVNIREPAEVTLLDGTDLKVRGTWTISSAGPHGLDLDRDGKVGYVACDEGAVVAIDLSTGEEVARVALPGSPDVTWFNPVHSELYVAVGEPGSLTVIDTSRSVVLHEIATERDAGTFAFDPQRQLLYLPRPSSGEVEVFAA